MIVVKEVKTRKEIKQFINLPIDMYKGNPNFVPPLYSSERECFKKKNPFSSACDTVYYLAYHDDKVVGRISGIIQKDANEKWKQKRVRFTRFDSINNQEVANALFSAVENWAKNEGMTEICGPLGFNDLEREGLLIEGFDQLSTFEEQYNFEYYQHLIEKYGFKGETDWSEREIRIPKDQSQIDKYNRISELVMRKHKLSYIVEKSVPIFIRKHKDEFFALLDDTYSDLYGTCPIRKEVQKSLLVGFKLLLRSDNIVGIKNEKGEMIAFGLYFPSIAKALQPSGGRLTPAAIMRVLKAIKKPEILDFGLIGVRKDYRNLGVPAMLMTVAVKLLKTGKYDHFETNLTLDTNLDIITLLEHFDYKLHKRRRSYCKTIY